MFRPVCDLNFEPQYGRGAKILLAKHVVKTAGIANRAIPVLQLVEGLKIVTPRGSPYLLN